MKNNRSVSIYLAIIIVLIYILYSFNILKSISCSRNLTSTFLRNFVHINPYHLVMNLIALYVLSRVEKDIGAKKFIKLILLLLILNTIAETIIYKFTDIQCAIGFSSILSGIMTWEIMNQHKLNWLLIFTMIIMPSVQNLKSSAISHVIGAISGIIIGFFWNYNEKKIEKNCEYP